MLLLPSFLFLKGALVQLYISQFNTCLAVLFSCYGASRSFMLQPFYLFIRLSLESLML